MFAVPKEGANIVKKLIKKDIIKVHFINKVIFLRSAMESSTKFRN